MVAKEQGVMLSRKERCICPAQLGSTGKGILVRGQIVGATVGRST